MPDEYLDIPKTLKSIGFTIHFKFSYKEKDIGKEFRFSMPNFGVDWKKDEEIPEIVKKKIGKRNTKKLETFVNESLHPNL
jgi:hypothetical protein